MLQELGVTAGDLSLVFVSAPVITRVNETFLRHAGATDVIAFDYRDPSEFAPGSLKGELLVCVEVALAQARCFRVPWQFEVVRYLVHGLLHLSGYDDRRPGPRRRMKREEDRLLRRLGRRFDLVQGLGGTPGT